MGLNKTLNRLLAMVDTEFVTYISGDDTMEPQRIKVHEAIMRAADNSVALAYSDARVIGPTAEEIHPSSRIEFPWPDEPARSEDTLACLISGNWIPAASFFMRTAVLQKEGGYSENLFYEDFELLTRLASRYRFIYTEEALVRVRRLDTSLGSIGFAHDSPPFIRSLAAAFRNAERGSSAEAVHSARSQGWELTKRASRVGMPLAEVLTMATHTWRGASSPAHALAHATLAVSRDAKRRLERVGRKAGAYKS